MGKAMVNDVTIVGAGLSGLSAALKLKRTFPDLSVQVLEANNRVGGRTLSVDVKTNLENGKLVSDSLDLGGHWISTSQPNIMNLAHDFGIEYYDQNITGTKLLETGAKNVLRKYSTDIPNLGSLFGLVELQLLLNKAEKMCKEVDISDPYAHPKAKEWDSMTLESYFRANTSYEEVVVMMEAAIVGAFGLHLSQMSLLFFLCYCNSAGGIMKIFLVTDQGAQEFRVKGGSQKFSECIRKEIGGENVHCNSQVIKVETNNPKADGGIIVSCVNGKQYITKHLIIAAPPNMINSIDFQPSLPKEKRLVFDAMKMPGLKKVYAIYQESFWLKKGFSGEYVGNGGSTETPGCSKGPVQVFYDATTKNGLPALVGFIGGVTADQWSTRQKEDLHEAVVQQIVKYWGEEGKHPNQIIVKDWAEEPHIRGGPANVMDPGRMHLFHHLRAPVGNVHFAGTNLATSWTGYLEGAVESGYRAAAEVIQIIDPSKLTEKDLESIKKAHKGRSNLPFHDKGSLMRYVRPSSLLIGLFIGLCVSGIWPILKYCIPYNEI